MTVATWGYRICWMVVVVYSIYPSKTARTVARNVGHTLQSDEQKSSVAFLTPVRPASPPDGKTKTRRRTPLPMPGHATTFQARWMASQVQQSEKTGVEDP